MTRKPPHIVVDSGDSTYERAVFFSDAVFAIAITLLVVDLRVPDVASVDAYDVLRDSGHKILGFGISFAVIGLFWYGHHAIFRHVRGFDRSLLMLNLLFLGSIAFLPFPTALFSAATQQKTAVVFYAASTGAAGLLLTALWVYASSMHESAMRPLSPVLKRRYTLRLLRTPVILLASIPVALWKPSVAPWMWILIFIIAPLLRRWAPDDETELAFPRDARRVDRSM